MWWRQLVFYMWELYDVNSSLLNDRKVHKIFLIKQLVSLLITIVEHDYIKKKTS